MHIIKFYKITCIRLFAEIYLKFTLFNNLNYSYLIILLQNYLNNLLILMGNSVAKIKDSKSEILICLGALSLIAYVAHQKK